MGWWSTTQIGSMKNNIDRVNLALMDFDMSHQCKPGMRENILVHSLVTVESTYPKIEASMVKSGLPTQQDIGSFGLVVKPHVLTEEPVQIWCLANQKELLSKSQGIVALGSAYIQASEPLQIQLDEQSIIYQHHSERSDALVFLDICAGGFGGWSSAASIMKTHHNAPFRKILGIDLDHAAMQQWCLNHNADYIETSIGIPWQVITAGINNVGIVADIQDTHWRQAVFAENPHIWGVSTPCISWSGAGEELGFYSSSGLTLVSAIGLAKLARPRSILFEQVRNFESHPHYPWFVQMITWAGYKLVFAKVLEASDHLPMSRPRWIGIAFDAMSSHNFDMSLFQPLWLGQQHMHPASFGCDWTLTDEMLKDMKIPANVLMKYFDPKLAPKVMKGVNNIRTP